MIVHDLTRCTFTVIVRECHTNRFVVMRLQPRQARWNAKHEVEEGRGGKSRFRRRRLDIRHETVDNNRIT
jgi:hypothetical protein